MDVKQKRRVALMIYYAVTFSLYLSVLRFLRTYIRAFLRCSKMDLKDVYESAAPCSSVGQKMLG